MSRKECFFLSITLTTEDTLNKCKLCERKIKSRISSTPIDRICANFPTSLAVTSTSFASFLGQGQIIVSPTFFLAASCWGTCPGPFALQSAETTCNGQIQSRGEKNVHHQRPEPCELIKRINKQISRPRSSESKRRKTFRSQVIDGALVEKEDRRSSYWIRETCNKSIRS